ncbi:S8 family serine peptidase [Thermodesulfobacteriota bacterium]
MFNMLFGVFIEILILFSLFGFMLTGCGGGGDSSLIGAPKLVTQSITLNRTETVVAPKTGKYYIRINAYAGASNYFLAIGQHLFSLDQSPASLNDHLVTTALPTELQDQIPPPSYSRGNSIIQATYQVGGTITAAKATAIDGDTNDPFSPEQDNNSFPKAQELSNPTVVGGFSCATATGNFGDRFGSTADLDDWYRVTLAQGHTITLTISDHDSGNLGAIDLDLYLYSSTQAGTAVSGGSASSGTLPLAPGSKTYSPATQPVISDDLRLEDDFVPGDIIVRFKKQNLVTHLSSSPTPEILAATVGLQAKAGVPGRAMLFNLGTPRQRRKAYATLGIPKSNATAQTIASADESLRLKYDTIRIVRALRKRTGIESAGLNYIRQTLRIPTDKYYYLQHHYPLINLPQAWDITTGDNNIVVAVVDTGVLISHPDLNANLCSSSDPCRGYDFISDPMNAGDGNGIDSDPSDPGDGNTLNSSSFHGTHVAGTVAAETNSSGEGSGVAGVSWNANIMPIRVLGKKGGYSYDIMQGILYAAGLPNDSGTIPAQSAQIINLSLGGGPPSAEEQTVYTDVRTNGNNGNGVIIIAAAGNEGANLLSYPASYEGVVSVSAVDMHKNRAYYSTFNQKVDITAPGGDTSKNDNGDLYPDGVLSTCGDDSSGTIQNVYKISQGTSMAAPHVAGVVALMKALHPTLTPADLDILVSAGLITEDISGDGTTNRNDFFGYGLVDALKAVQLANSLANGNPLPPILSVSPNTLSFENSDTSLTLTTSNAGGGILAITDVQVINSPGWINIIPSSVDNNNIGTYTVTVDRADLIDGLYNSTIQFTTAGGSTTNVQVIMQVGVLTDIGNTGYHWVILVNQDTHTTTMTTQAPIINGRYTYGFSGVSPGNYYILAGTDSDNDGFLCDDGEACSGYPIVNQLIPVPVSSGDLLGLDFFSGFPTSIQSTDLDSLPIPRQGFSRVPQPDERR